MPRKKTEFKLLTRRRILRHNPERKTLVGSKKKFEDLLNKALNQEPFDKKRK